VIYQHFPSVRKSFVDRFLPTAQAQQQQLPHHPVGTTATEARPNGADKKRADQFKITPDEFVRRDKIVRQMFLENEFHVGEVLSPIKLGDREKYGNVSVRGIWKSYHDFPTAEAMAWPQDDYPYIMTVQPTAKQDDGTELILCNATWLVRPKK
jgi:hypothetical protein